MAVTLTETVLSHLDEGRLTPSELVLYIRLLNIVGDSSTIDSVADLASTLSVAPGRLSRVLRKLDGMDLIIYRPTNNRHHSSFIGAPNGNDKPNIRSIGAPNGNDKQSIGAPNGNDRLADTPSDQQFFDADLVEANKRATKKGLSGVDVLEEKTQGPGRPKRTFAETERPYVIAKMLYTLITENLDRKARADMQEWAAHVERLHRIDERDYEDIEKVVTWLYDPSSGKDADFWRGNILSTKSLRKQFTRLWVKMNGYRPATNIFGSLDDFDNLEV